MIKIQCQKIHQGCGFVVEGKINALVITEYAAHASEQHGIDYSLINLMKFALDNESEDTQFKTK